MRDIKGPLKSFRKNSRIVRHITNHTNIISTNGNAMDGSTLSEIIITSSIKTNNFIQVNKWIKMQGRQIIGTKNIDILTFMIKNTFNMMLSPYMEITIITNILYTNKP